MIKLSIVVLILSSSALEQDGENATVTTNATTDNIVEQITENLEEVEGQKIIDPVIERSSHYHYTHEDHHHEPTYHGFWKKKVVWRPRWVKTWQEKKVYVAVWKRMWGPAMLNEWVPIPKPPPGWVKHGVGSFVALKHPH
ncbi:hypothetical protein ABMA27_000245 [Loxostege sticticalis]|uniref:Uncharacterized protein n=1 Tax=Loxostege sticticalis TaxID=481309 RepID=A0ABR3IMQ1_LOXSC